MGYSFEVPLWGFSFRLMTFALALVCASRAASADDTSPEKLFDKQVAPLLAVRCLSCHDSREKKGDLDLSRRDAALQGGQSGVVIEPGKLDESLLWDKVSADEMPPKKPLTDAEKKIIKDWIQGGAKWGADPIDPFKFSTEHRAGYDWWSLQPVRQPPLPEIKNKAWPRNGIDYYILAKLEANGLSPAPEADRRTYIRRLSFDLLGLPPTIEEVAAFEADKSAGAYEKLVDRYLKSPAYGERWARHWLDIVRFGESQGFERDKLRTTSWRYRDWVVWALNEDIPYSQFILEQIAGDVVYRNDPLAVVATGYLVAAPWDEVGQSQLSAAMRAVVRQDELEDIIGTTAQTFLGLTANCARCHDHKFDPISQREYYQLAASLGGVRHGERESLTSEGRAEAQQRSEKLEVRHQQLASELAALEKPLRDAIQSEFQSQPPPRIPIPAPIARWEFDGDLRDGIGKMHGTAFGAAKVEQGRLILDGEQSYVTTAGPPHEIKAKTFEAWVKLRSLKQQGGGVMTLQNKRGHPFDSLVFGERESGKWFPGSEGFKRSIDLVDADPETVGVREFVHMAAVYQADQMVSLYRNGQPYGRPYKAVELVNYVPSESQVVFGMRHSPPGGNRMLAGEIERAQLYDKALTAEQIAASAGLPTAPSEMAIVETLIDRLTPQQLAERNRLVRLITQIEAEQTLLRGGTAYSVQPRQPEATHLLLRGNPGTPGDEVAAGSLRAVGATYRNYDLPKDSNEGQRRQDLAEWIGEARNPLTSRVLVNRLWHYHFGVGIVDTPNDFGFNGGRPSHPELLDWLAMEYSKEEESLKTLNRTIVLSATYRQGSRFNEAAHKVDADNRWLWRKSPIRLDAEAIRDAVLAVTGELNPAMGGPGYKDFETFTSNSQFYQQIDPVGYEFQRRSLYRTWVRSSRNPLLDVLDCPDPSTTAPKRAVTTTPLQALALLNNSFMLRMCDKLAARVQHESPTGVDGQVKRVYERVYQRSATADELRLTKQFVSQHGLPALARVLFNGNEFLYVD